MLLDVKANERREKSKVVVTLSGLGEEHTPMYLDLGMTFPQNEKVYIFSAPVDVGLRLLLFENLEESWIYHYVALSQ